MKLSDITRNIQQSQLDSSLSTSLSSTTTAIDRPLSILCSTTNSLLESRFEYFTDDEWHDAYLKLMSTLIQCSEDLEMMSLELLKLENQVTQLKIIESAMLDEYEEHERIYKSRLEECEEISRQQIELIQRLIDLDKDLITNDVIERTSYSVNKDGVLLVAPTKSLTSICHHQSFFHRQEAMVDNVMALRWEAGLWLNSRRRGQVLHRFEGALNSLELIIAGSGLIVTPTFTLEDSFIQSRIIKHIRLHRHHYVLHINRHDRETKFRLLSKIQWTPDEQINQCQFRLCTVQFNLFQRKHHCRRYSCMWAYCLSKT
ncbi:uncharacterized protein BX663DRAFT_522864 [Cokeromyces recurvatus]|uniref:uncharacterized protein n=1 Tax=Cokeromyces recurvatus TaxID=90255 RepID=UPI00221EEA2B|nr:uncharacterized protein BX663DRAFT_522864 [Cokeromyces recurvatus]KAI7899020.1 hypothetical protein BX663DRAFT_522864 [Cokeromyces recurvatus]